VGCGRCGMGEAINLVSVPDLARSLGRTVRGLNKMIQRGELPRPFAVGRRRYWRRQTLDAWIARRERDTEGTPAPDGPSR